MCYQVVERYYVCRCLYYKHPIDPCPAHGERGHFVQEKTVLVGYLCSSHFSHSNTTALGEDLVIKDLVYDTNDSSDESDDDGSIFSAITLSRATSFISAGGEDTIQEILQVLLSDPLLRWDKLMNQHEDRSCSEMKDVRFFLKTFEMDLRTNASNTLEYHACAFLRSRIRYLSSQICQRFDILDIEHVDAFSKTIDSLQAVTIEEPDATLMPPFKTIRCFMFDGFPYQGLKENIKNFTQNIRDPFAEMLDILAKNIHPPERILRETCAEDIFSGYLSTFLSTLGNEAAVQKLSASDIASIKSVEARRLATKARLFWASDSPLWHFYPPLISSVECASSNTVDMYVEANPRYEAYEAFVVSSNAFLSLTLVLTKLPMSVSRMLAATLASTIRAGLVPRPRATMNPEKHPLLYQCPCGENIIDYYTESSPGGLSKKLKQLRLLAVRQTFQQATSRHSAKRGGMGSFFQGFFYALAPGNTAKGSQLPHHHVPSHISGGAQTNDCTSQAQSSSHIHNFIHWCVPHGQYATRMFPLQCCGIKTDVDFFRGLNNLYVRSSNRYQTLLSFKKPVALRFVKFRLHHRQLVDIQKAGDIPPESQKHEYDYSPMPAETIPPIGPNLLMHFFTHPEEAASHNVILRCIPKRKIDKLEPCPIAGSSTGWGIDIITGIDQLKLFGLGFLGSIASVVFGIVWAIVKSDIQGGFAVAGFMLTLFGFAIASLKALDF